MKKMKGIKRFLAAMMAVALIVTGLPEMNLKVSAATATNVAKEVDASTADSYQNMLGKAEDGARYAGRIWTDKSVYKNSNVALDGMSVDNDANFMVVYSALGSTTATNTKTAAKLDVVIVLDNSMSMGMTNPPRLNSVTSAANTLINDLLKNEESRLAIVTYSNKATTLLPLDYYTKVSSTTNVLSASNTSNMNRGGQLTATAINDAGTRVSNTNDGYQNGTNLQSGIDAGMKILANASDKGGRTPVMIVLTDGVADSCVTRGWYDFNQSYSVQVVTNDLTPVSALGTLLNAAYNKAIVEKAYGQAPVVYGVGVDLSNNSEGHSVMDPANSFNDDRNTPSDVRTAYGYYEDWVESNSTVSVRQGNRNFSYEQLPSTSTVTKQDVIDNINYVDKYHNVASAELEDIFKEIVKEITERLLSPIEDTLVRDEIVDEVPLTFVDFVGEYMEVKSFKAVTLFGQSYSVTAGTPAIEDTTSDGVTTRVTTTPYRVGSGQTVTNPALGVSFNISQEVRIELKETTTGTLAGSVFTPNAVPKQEVWIYVSEEALPLWYSTVKNENGEITYTYDNNAKPIRVYYTVDVSDDILHPNGKINLSLVDKTYIDANKGTDGSGNEVIYFYANQFNTMNKDGNDADTLPEYGDAHASAMIADSNRYYYHQDNHVIYSATSATNDEWNANENSGSYGLLYYQGDGVNYPASSLNYDTTELTYADVVALNSDSTNDSEQYVYATVGFYRPKENASKTTNADGSITVEGEAVSYLIRATWEEMKIDTAFYDTVNQVYINGIDVNGDFVTSATVGYAVDDAVISQYLSETTNVTGDQIKVYYGIGSWRLSRLNHHIIQKSPNATGTATASYAPTYNVDDIHVGNITVWQGNNARLEVKNEDLTTKTVSVNGSAEDQNGNIIMVGDELTYYIKVENNEGAVADAVVTDKVPVGTELVKDPGNNNNYVISHGGSYNETTGIITWNLEDMGVDEIVTVSFKVRVTEKALDNAILTVNNTATIQVGNSPTYNTNPVENHPQGKTVGGAVEGIDPSNGIKVGDQLTYYIHFYNNKDTAVTVTIQDTIPAGTVYVPGTADHGGNYDEATGIITWSIPNVQPGMDGIVSFDVVVDAGAKTPLINGATIQIGNNTYTTNQTGTAIQTGDLLLNKVVTNGVGDFENKEFTFVVSSVGYSDWNSTFNVERKNGTTITTDTIQFTNGVAEVTIKHGESILIKEMPVGLVLNVSEKAAAGYTPTFTTTQVTITEENKNDTSFAANASVNVTNAYHAEPIVFQLKGSKRLETFNNAYFDGATFSILVQACNDSWAVQNTGTTAEVHVSSDAATGTAVFAPKTITAAGTYRFLITEIDTNLTGVTYDKTQYRLTVVVDDNGNGQLVFDTETTVDTEKCMLQKDNNGDGNFVEVPVDSFANFDGSKVTFKNTYKPHELDIELEGTKTLNGLDLIAGRFSFLVKDSAGNVVTSGTNAGANAGVAGAVDFGIIAITEAGDYTYTITEAAGSLSGMDYDETQYRLSITVIDDAGTLKITSYKLEKGSVGGTFTVVSTSESALTSLHFVNSFAPEDVNLVLTANKKLWTRSNPTSADEEITNTLVGGEYSFKITTDEAGNNVVASGHNAKYDAGTSLITFSPIYFDYEDLGTHTYWIHEVVPAMGRDQSIKYDTNKYSITLKVEYDTLQGLLVKDSADNIIASKNVSAPYSTSVEFNNYDFPDAITIKPVGYKTTVDSSNNPYINDSATFSFSGINTETQNTVYTGSAKAGTAKEIEFTTMSYSGPGEWTYWIKETNAGSGVSNGVTYDPKMYLMKVKIERLDGELSGNVTYWSLKSGGDPQKVEDYTEAVTPNEVLFNNKYSAKGNINITAKKGLVELDGNGNEISAVRGLKDGEFSFKLERKGVIENGNVVHDYNEIVTGYNTASGEVKFATLYFTDDEFNGKTEMDVVYIMSEIKPTGNSLPGVIYDLSEYELTIHLTHDSLGNITSTVTKIVQVKDSNGALVTKDVTAEGIIFKNQYQSVATIQISGTKELTGRTLRKDEFMFGIYYNGVLVESTTNKADGTFAFTMDIPTTTTKGTYNFVLKEINTGLSGITYDSREYPFVVQIDKNDKTGAFTASVGIENNVSIKFENRYVAESTQFKPVLTKTLTGRPMRAGEFSFVINEMTGPDANGNYTASDTIVSTGLSQVADVGVASNIEFIPITYADKPGANQSVVHRYVIREVKGAELGVEYTSKAIYLAVTVTDDGHGKLNVTDYKYYKNPEFTEIESDLNFTNEYVPKDTSVVFQAEKVLTGREMQAKEFDFVVKELWNSKGNAIGSIVSAGDNAAAADGVNAEITFAEIGFNEAGKHIYEVSEVAPDAQTLNGITFDKTKYYALVEVKDNLSGNLEVEVGYYTSYNNGSVSGKITGIPVFVNTYDPADATGVTFSANKTLIGKELKAKEFTFVFTDLQANTAMEVTNDATGKLIVLDANQNAVPFQAVSAYTAVGVYKYTLTENASANSTAGGTYGFDNTVYTIVVDVTDDGTGQLKASTTYYKNGEAPENVVQVMNFTNTYKPAKLIVDLTAALDAKKTVQTPAGVTYPLDGFAFEVTDITGALILEGTSDSTGKINFEAFEFEQSGEYAYIVSEKVISGRHGITFDTDKWEIHILVSYDNETGKLYVSDGDIIPFHTNVSRAVGDDIIFVNVYDPSSAQLNIHADKVLTGRDLTYHEFGFQLLENGIVIAEARNDAAGHIEFSVDIDEVGTYTYEVKEMIPSDPNRAPGVDYDDTVYSVTIEVVDDHSGQLKIRQSGTADEASKEIKVGTFENVYTPASTEYIFITAEKILNGADLTADAFEFELLDESNQVVGTAKNKTDGTILFKLDPVTAANMVDAQGNLVDRIVKNYKIREVAGSDSNITYDTAEYAVTVTVTDDKLGQLQVEVAYGTDTGAAPVFTNTYTDPIVPGELGVQVHLVGTKALLGGTMADGQFTFNVQLADGRSCGYGVSKADGTIEFMAMSFGESEVGRHVLTVSEINDGQKGITYDSKKLEVIVDVHYSSGDLDATVYYPEGGLAFVNRVSGYNGSPNTGDSSPIMLLLGLLVVAMGGLGGLLVWRKKKEQ